MKGRVLAFIDKDGNLVDTAGNTNGVAVPTHSNGNFYAAIYHRTCIPLMSWAIPTGFVDQVNGAFAVNFTKAVGQAFGTDALTEVTGVVWPYMQVV